MTCEHQRKTSWLSPAQVITEQQSLLVIKKLLAVAVSGITYLRGIVPEKAFGMKYVGDHKVMILREDRSCPGVIAILQWLRGCFEAIQRKYLRTVFLLIYTDPENPQKVTEFYQFRIRYTGEGAQMDLESNNNNKVSMPCGDTKKASILLVRKLYILMQSLGPLPERVCINMKLSYYDDVTPHNYQPPGFKEADGTTMQFEFQPINLAMGEVVTPFHSLTLDMTTESHRMEEVEESVHVKEKWSLQVGEDDVITESRVPEAVQEPTNGKTEMESREIQMSSDKKTEAGDAVCEDASVQRLGELQVGVKRTRSGRIIKPAEVNSQKSTAVKQKLRSHYYIPTSQETPSCTVSNKRRKVSKPKDSY